MRSAQRSQERVEVETESTAEPDRRTLTLDEAFGLLQNGRRRTVVRQLRSTPETTIGDLAERVAAEEYDTTREQIRSEDRKRVYIALYQSHLPALADAGVVTYDSNSGHVERLDPADRLDEQLRTYSSRPSTRTLHLRAACAAVAAVVVLGALGVPPLGAVHPSVWAVVGISGLVALAVTAD